MDAVTEAEAVLAEVIVRDAYGEAPDGAVADAVAAVKAAMAEAGD